MPKQTARLPASAPAYLLQTAAIIDFSISIVALRTAIHFAGLENARWEFLLALGAAIVAIHWFLIEVIFAGKSIGRGAVGLELTTKDGRLPGLGAGIIRFIRKLTGFWRGLVPGRIAPYLRGADIFWRVSLGKQSSNSDRRSVPPPRPAPHDWKIQVANGPLQGKIFRLTNSRNFRNTGRFKIGSSSSWSDLSLKGCIRVSRRHAEIRRNGNSLIIFDVGTDGRGSTHGTKVHGRQVPPGGSLPLGNADHVKIADINLRIFV